MADPLPADFLETPRICVSLARRSSRRVVESHASFAAAGATLAEYRLDMLGNVPDVSRLLADRPTPVIITCRTPEDGGRWSRGEDERRGLLRQAVLAGAEFVDLEREIAKSIPRYGDTRRIVSHHDHEGTPGLPELRQLWEELAGLDADVVKLVTTATSAADVLRVLSIVQEANQKGGPPTVGFCMGDLGAASRVLCAKFGSPFTYAAADEAHATAPGQFLFEELKDLYRFESIGPKTRFFAVMGDPIDHSLSPQLHNPTLQAAGFDGVYLPIRVPAGDFAAEFAAWAKLGLAGASVTIPHKLAALAIAEEKGSLAERIGAANTLVRVVRKADGEKVWKAVNTDCRAVSDSIVAGLKAAGRETDLSGREAVVLGSGGVSRAIAVALAAVKCRVTISGRTEKKGKALASELGCQHQPWSNRGAVEADIVANGTPVGMVPDIQESPYKKYWIRPDAVVFDAVYTPRRTQLIADAIESGAVAVDGGQMFYRQAKAQYELFTGGDAPPDAMWRAFSQAVSPVVIPDDVLAGMTEPPEAR